MIRRARFCFVSVRNRPFNLQGGGLWFFVSFRIFFSDNTRGRIFIFFCRAKREIFFRSSTLGYMTKTLNQIIFFLHQNQNFCSATLGIRIFFQKKNITPPCKLIGRSLKYVNNLTRKGYGLANLVQSMRQVYFAPNIDNLLIQLVAGADPGERGRTPRAPP